MKLNTFSYAGIWPKAAFTDEAVLENLLALNPKSEIEFLQWEKKTTDYTDYTDYTDFFGLEFFTIYNFEKLQMEPISICEIREIRVIRG